MALPASMHATLKSSIMTSDTAIYPNPRKTLTVRRLGLVDVDELAEAVRAIPEAVWALEDQDKPNKFETLASTRHIVFRFIQSFADWRESYDRPIWKEWSHLVQPVLDAAVADYGYARGAFPRIMLARMSPGGVIRPHRDTGPAAHWPHKIHVPIVTNKDVVFYVDAVPHHFAEGEAVEVNNMTRHSVENRGSTDRIHLIFEYYDLDQQAPAWAPSRSQQ